MKYKGYTGSVEYSAEDGCLFGQVQGIGDTLISYEGASIDEIREDFEGAVEDYLAFCEETGREPIRPFNGDLNLRMPSELYAAVASAASSAGTSINDFINNAMSEILHLRAVN